MRRILQAKGLDPEKDVTLLSMNTTARLQSLLSGNVAGAMVTPPTTYFAIDRGFQVMGRGKDYMRYLQTGVVATDAAIKANRETVVRFLRAWDRGLKFYQDNPEIMIPYIQKKLAVKDAKLARRMYKDDVDTISLTGILSRETAKEIVDIGREALHMKEPVPTERIFDFSLATEALR
jgi:ABC-type nitrate/sulfonate/bicarbonate transport system substrate-binding protein